MRPVDDAIRGGIIRPPRVDDQLLGQPENKDAE